MKPDVRPQQGAACPAWETLVAFHSGRLSDPELEGIASHLSSCSTCESLLEEWTSQSGDDSLANYIRRCLAEPTPAAERGYEDMESRAKALARTDVYPGPRPGASPPLPEQVGPYEIQGMVGRGGMGLVFRARHRLLRREVALKRLLWGAYAGDEARERFRTEAEAISRIQHLNVVQLYEFGESDGQPYFAMEWVGGGNLADRLAEGALLPRPAAALIRDLARGVESAHAQDVLHRDLKPSNILLTADNVPKISDFGLAKLIDDGGSGSSMTQTGAILGTIGYMAPEQASGQSGKVGPAADIYALGSILYEALTGSPPFRGATKGETRQQVLRAEPAPPSRLKKGIPAALDLICLKCLDKVPKRRYASAGALAADLDRWLRDGYHPRDPFGRIRRWIRARRRALQVGLMGLMLPVGFATLSPSDPDLPLRHLQAELRQGRAVTLIGETGKPAWSRWRSGEPQSQMSTSADGTFSVHTWGFALLELMPDPQTDRYRFDVDIRHVDGRVPGHVGVFVGHRTHSNFGTDTQSFATIEFDDVGATTHRSDLFSLFATRSGMSEVSIAPYLCSEHNGSPNYCHRLYMQSGPKFAPAGSGSGQWHHLAVTVMPDGIWAEWDKQPLNMTAIDICNAMERGAEQLRQEASEDTSIQTLQPQFVPTGGLGISLSNASATFRAATVTPLSIEGTPAPQPANED